MPDKSTRPAKPGWLFIDRYMPNAALEEQEAAYENLVSLVKLLMQIDERLFEEEEETKRAIQPPLFR